MDYEFVNLKQVESTNDTAKQLALEGASEGVVVSAERQTMGKGRLGRKWISGGGCYFSIILKPRIRPETASQLTLVAGIAAANAISKLTGVFCGIKWPNDILIKNKKVCGILVEMNVQMNFAILGIGINVKTENFPDDLRDKATSIYMETGEIYEPNIVMNKVLEAFADLYESFISQGGFKPFANEYKRLCRNLNRQVVIEGKIGLCTDISDNGELVVLYGSGDVEYVNSGEVSIRAVTGYI